MRIVINLKRGKGSSESVVSEQELVKEVHNDESSGGLLSTSISPSQGCHTIDGNEHSQGTHLSTIFKKNSRYLPLRAGLL